MKEKKIIKISFEGNSPYEANKILAEMESFLMDSPAEIEIKREKNDRSTMDLGNILTIILNSAAVVIIAQGIYAQLIKHKGLKIKIYNKGKLLFEAEKIGGKDINIKDIIRLLTQLWRES